MQLMGIASAPPILRARFDFKQPRDKETVIASAAKQSISPREERMDCFVASLLAMTPKRAFASRGAMRDV
jgi:hypothetical protein